MDTETRSGRTLATASRVLLAFIMSAVLLSRGEGSGAGSWFGGAVFAATFSVGAVVLLGRTGRTERNPGSAAPRPVRDALSLIVGDADVTGR